MRTDTKSHKPELTRLSRRVFDMTYATPNYSPDQVVSRYVRLSIDGRFEGCEVGHDRRYNLRTWHLSEGEIASLTPEQVQRCGELRGYAFSYVEWPL